MPGDITLPDKDEHMYTVSRQEPSASFESLGLRTNLCGTSDPALEDVTKVSQEFSTQMNNAKCNKTSCLNVFKTSFMPTLSYRMIATQFTEREWNKAIRPAIRVTCNAAGMAKNFSRAVLFGQQKYQGIGVKNPFFLQEIIHITAFLNETACNSSTGELFKAYAEFFRVELGVPFSLTSTPYNEKTFASYMPQGWYKSLWKFMSNPLYNLDITEDYDDLPLLRNKDVYIMQAFVNKGFKNADLKALNFVRKFIQAVSLTDIATTDGHRISHRSYDAIESNGLRKELRWPKAPDELPLSSVNLWKAALNKCFINHNSSIQRRISNGLCLGDWFDKWIWWSVPGVSRIYQRLGEGWSYYSQRRRRYYLNEVINNCPFDLALPISVSTIANSFKIQGPVAAFALHPPVNSLSDFEDEAEWSTLSEGFDNAITDPTILLDKFILPEDGCTDLVEGIRLGTACVVLDGSFDAASPIGPAGSSAVILASSIACHKKSWTKGCNWVTGPKSAQSAYRSECKECKSTRNGAEHVPAQ